MFYGRARRIELAKKVGLILGIIIALVLLIIFIIKKVDFVDHNVNYAYLRQYLISRGYTCERIEVDGGKCFIKGSSNYQSFTRYSIGFEYLVRSDAYILQIRHLQGSYSDIKFTTNDKALVGVKNKDFICHTKGNLLGELEYCDTSDALKLTTASYVGVVESAINDVNSIIEASGYKKYVLINDYIWEKK